jgi:hypothetical protein
MSEATITDISTAEKRARIKAATDSISLGVMLPEALYDKIKLDSILSKSTIGSMVEEWIDQNVSLQDVSIGLATLMNSTSTREKVEAGITMKGLTITISKRHYGMLKMEAIRQQTTIRSLLKSWIQENTKEWIFEPVEEHNEWQDRQAA